MHPFAAFARNNAWSNHRLLGACAQLDRAALHAPRVSFFPTIMHTLNHIVTVDWYYVDALTAGGRGRSVFDPECPFDELAPLRAAQRAVDLQLVAFADAGPEPGAAVTIPRRHGPVIERVDAVLMHLFVHQIHHRGQVHAMLSGTDVSPPQLDEYMLREDLPVRRRELEELGLA